MNTSTDRLRAWCRYWGLSVARIVTSTCMFTKFAAADGSSRATVTFTTRT